MAHNPEFTKALASLQQAHQDLVRSNYHVVYMTSYVASLYHATNTGISSNDKTCCEQLPSYWIPYFNRHLERKADHEIHKKDIELFFDLLVKADLLGSFTQNAAYANTLACLCLLSAKNQEFHIAATLLDHWNPSGSSSAIDSLSSMVDHIYGAACWILYRDEVAHDAQIPLYIWRLQLPLAGIAARSGKTSEGIELPSELAMH